MRAAPVKNFFGRRAFKKVMGDTIYARHWQIVYDDGTNSGYFGDDLVFGADKDKSRYDRTVLDDLDDILLRKAEKEVQAEWREEKKEYDLINNNCQNYIMDVLRKYHYYRRRGGGRVIAEYEEGLSTWQRRFYYGPGIDEPIAIQVKYAGLFYYHYDGLGSVVALSDSSGNIVERYEYDVFGQVTIRDANDQILTTSAYANPYYFTGRRYDDETGLYYYRARYYHPEIGRFMQVYTLLIIG